MIVLVAVTTEDREALRNIVQHIIEGEYTAEAGALEVVSKALTQERTKPTDKKQPRTMGFA
jgi:hypothetical protein